jgi:hypothetical protein
MPPTNSNCFSSSFHCVCGRLTIRSMLPRAASAQLELACASCGIREDGAGMEAKRCGLAHWPYWSCRVLADLSCVLLGCWGSCIGVRPSVPLLHAVEGLTRWDGGNKEQKMQKTVDTRIRCLWVQQIIQGSSRMLYRFPVQQDLGITQMIDVVTAFTKSDGTLS